MKKSQKFVSRWTDASSQLGRDVSPRRPRAVPVKVLACFTACLLVACLASASPEMAAVSETSSTQSITLSLQNYASLWADEAEALDLVGLFTAWSAAAGLNTYPFVGTLITLF